MESLKIKTITCHDVYNFGASLQAYALMRHLEMKGHEVAIIDYKPDYLTFNLWAIGGKWNRNILMRWVYFIYVVPKRLMMKSRRNKFDHFTRKRLNITPDRFPDLQSLQTNPPEADVFFAGSDQIWNPLLPNGSDGAFYLSFVKNGVKASYAASLSVQEIPEANQAFMRDSINALDYIAVREPSGLKLVHQLGINRGEVVVDPVYLLPGEVWNKLATLGKDYGKYIFIYDQENNKPIKEAALKLKQKYGYNIVAIEALYPMGYADFRIKNAGPEDFLGLIKNAAVVLTNSFHCMSFCLIFRNQFFVFRRTHLKVNSRMEDLLKYLELPERIVEISDLEITDIDFDRVSSLLQQRIESSYSYIDKVLAHAQQHTAKA